MRLEEINKIYEILQALVKEAETIGEQANGNLTMAVETANRSKDLAGQRKREAQSALDNATNAHSDTLQASSDTNNLLKTAMRFKVSKSFESSRSSGPSSSSDILCSVNIGRGFHGVSLSICRGLEYSEKFLLASFLVSEGSLGWFGLCVWKGSPVEQKNIIWNNTHYACFLSSWYQRWRIVGKSWLE